MAEQRYSKAFEVDCGLYAHGDHYLEGNTDSLPDVFVNLEKKLLSIVKVSTATVIKVAPISSTTVFPI